MKWADIAAFAQVVVVVIGVVISIWVFYAARETDAETQRIEAAKQFLQLRQDRYTEALKMAAVLANPETHSAVEITDAKKRFRELYVAELSMVEVPAVEAKMVGLASQVDQDLLKMTPAQMAAYELAHALRDSLVLSYGIKQ